MTDTDGDGRADIFETSGMRLSDGRIVYTDPAKADTDGDGLKDGEEIYLHNYQIISGTLNDDGTYTENFTTGYQFFMTSDPRKVDSDGDEYNDYIDFDPLCYDSINGLIYQSPKLMGIGYDGKSIADDLKTNDYTDSDMLNINSLFSYQISSSENELESDFRFMCDMYFSYGSKIMVNQLIDAFIYGTDRTVKIKTEDGLKEVPYYSNQLLAQKVYEDEQVQNYIEYAKDTMIAQIKKYNGNLILAKQSMQSIIDSSNVSRIAFTRDNPSYLFGGMTISINDLWGSNVCITNYSCDGTNFSGTLHFNLYDHFGLDEPDVKGLYGYLAGFRAWYRLQHSKNFNGKYKPYINAMEYDVCFEGQLS